MLILPPFQGEGHGAQLLEAVHRFYCGLPKVQDITGEGLSLAFLPLAPHLALAQLGLPVHPRGSLHLRSRFGCSVSFSTEPKYFFCRAVNILCCHK